MSKIMQDPLLTFSRALLIFLMGVLAFSALMLCIGLGGVLTVMRGEALAEIAQVGAPDGTYGIIIVLLVMLIALMALGFRFIMELRGIVLSVKDGDPFQDDNAARLSRMGWITVGGYALTIPVGLAASYLVQFTEETEGADVDMGFGGGGLLLILTLFILARVFRTGTEMRDDLEGTV